MKTKEYVFEKTLTKRPCIYKRVGNVLYPVLYFQKAKGATDEDYEEIVEHLMGKK